ncbi:ABC transporter permease [Methylococcus geothermalis]|uniref:Iron export ABC transporter permease subunit FetB n=1 Tax=Methylococcus geothermalis TaxID=2681310 RepID=A0A858Q4D7_9GAMM|nr:iron export ABC transporter permease subunit FetB [Methylococcus geothermalis]QJD28673.1 iron export ABC transporter permease subunit FetB [Methylococcus geothermalis]
MDTVDISPTGMALLYGIAILPWLLLRTGGLRLSCDLWLSIFRMSLQLALVGLYLKYLFAINDPVLNLAWIAVMLIVADFTIVRRAGLRSRHFFLSTLAAITVGTLFSVAYLLLLVIRPEPLYDARYLVPLTGMILGNCLQGNVIGLERFYSAIRKNENEYLTYLLLGATRREAVRPYFREALKASVSPTLASMATLGLVSLPGMMTGQILGGSEPWVAVKYQIAIMLCIFASMSLAAVLNLALSLRFAFNEFDVLREVIFRHR